jgi:hypothetical protein
MYALLMIGTEVFSGETHAPFSWARSLWLLFFVPLFMIFGFLAALFEGMFGLLHVVMPTVFAGIMFWLATQLIVPRLGLHAQWRNTLASATFGLLVGALAFVAFDPSVLSGSWNDLYFYRPRDLSISDYSEWGISDAMGPWFYLAALGLTGFALGTIFTPKVLSSGSVEP